MPCCYFLNVVACDGALLYVIVCDTLLIICYKMLLIEMLCYYVFKSYCMRFQCNYTAILFIFCGVFM